MIVAPVRLLIILLPIVEELDDVELELDVVELGVVVEVDEVDGVVVLVIDAVVVGTLLLLLTLDTIIMTSSGPLMTRPQVDVSNFHAIKVGSLAHPISKARAPIEAADWPEPAWPWPLAAEFDREPVQPSLENSQHPEFDCGMRKYLCSYW